MWKIRYRCKVPIKPPFSIRCSFFFWEWQGRLFNGMHYIILGKHMSEKPPEATQHILVPYADRSILFSIVCGYRTSKIQSRIWWEIFIVAKLTKDAIFNMPFLILWDCTMDFSHPVELRSVPTKCEVSYESRLCNWATTRQARCMRGKLFGLQEGRYEKQTWT